MGDAERPRNTNSSPPPSDTVIVLPVRKTVLFPGIILPLAITGRFSPLAAQEAVRNDRMPVIVPQADPEVEDPAPDQLYQIGSLARVLRFVTGVHHLVVQGVRRIRLLEFLPGFPFLVAQFEEVDDAAAMTSEIQARVDLAKFRAREAIQLLPNVPPEVSEAIETIDSASVLADRRYPDRKAANTRDDRCPLSAR